MEINTPEIFPIAQVRIETDRHRYIPKQYVDVAQSMERQFAEYMLKEMHSSIGENPEESSTAGDFYKNLELSERAALLAQKNQLGLQDVILDQIYPKKMRNEITYNHYLAKTRPKLPKLPTMKQSENNATIVQERERNSPEVDTTASIKIYNQEASNE